ncbi:sulfite exporter TauE/SafE family protein [Candidatus Woesearchaeota archaeon]|nr:sulfite exporter TauE/SafE family protein [Candidatus Woesearchaeota archaeon]
MPEITFILMVIGIGLVCGFFDAVIGAGGLISVPALIFLGLPANIAIATERFGTLGTCLTFFKYWKAKKIVWSYVPVLVGVSLVGSLIGAFILITISDKILGNIIGILLLVLLPLLFLKTQKGTPAAQPTPTKKIIGVTLYFFIMIFAGFFGQGTGPMMIFALTFFCGMTIIEVMGTSVIPWIALWIVSVGIFASHGLIDYSTGLILLPSMAVGGWFGAHMAIKNGEGWVKVFFAVVVVALAMKLLFG